MQLNKRKPKEQNDTEKMLYTWLNLQRNNNNKKIKIMLNKNIKYLWDNFIKDYNQYFLSNEELWTNNLTELKSFIDLNKRRPNIKKDSEKMLGKWLANQFANKKAEKSSMLNENIRNSWDNFIKDYKQYFISNEELWTNKLTELKIFIDLNKRRPLEKKMIEKVLTSWLSTQIKNRKTEKQIMLNEDIRNV